MHKDYMLMYSKDEERYSTHMKNVLSRPNEHEMYIAAKKCNFTNDEFEFPGLLIRTDGPTVNLDKVGILKTLLKPKSVTAIRILWHFTEILKIYFENCIYLDTFNGSEEQRIGMYKWNKSEILRVPD